MSLHNTTPSYHEYAQGILRLDPDEQLQIITMVLSQLQFTMTASSIPRTSKLANLLTRHLIHGAPDELITLKVWEWNEQPSQ